MRTKLKAASTRGALERVLEALKEELIDASDEEVSAAARELRMNLGMPESAAFAGLTHPARPQLSDFFELEAFRQMRLVDERASLSDSAETARAVSPRKARRSTSQRGLRGRKKSTPDDR